MHLKETPPYMFKNPMIDYFFRWRWWAAPVAFSPILAGLIIGATTLLFMPWPIFFTLSMAGLMFWTLFEYVMHRFFFHFISTKASLEHMHYVVHGMHHAFPNDPVRVIFPPFASVLVGGIIASLFLLVLPLGHTLAIFSGFIVGYIWYEFMHYAAHHIKWKTKWFARLKRHHLLHHHSSAYAQKNFGVTTSIWDRIFKTYLA